VPFKKIAIRPGVSVELTPTLNEGGYSESQLIRFFAGQLQKIGGWTKIAGVTIAGICRALFAWADLVGTYHLAIGSEQRLYVLTGGALSDITPVVATSNIPPAVQTIAGSTTITITDSSYTPAIGDWIYLGTAIGIAGASVSVPVGFYQVIALPSATSYSLATTTTALASSGPGVVAKYTTVLGSPIVTVVLPNHGLIVGAAYNATPSTTVGGLIINGTYSATTVLDTNTFQITAGGSAITSATASVNSGNMQISYLLPSGQDTSMALGGFGAGDFGGGDFGGSDAGSTSPLVVPLRTWSLDHFGQDLIASPDLGKIYYWAPPAIAPAIVLSATAPIINRVVFAMPQIQIIVAAGSSFGSSYNPTLLRWSDSGDFTDWDAAVTNQAGSFQLPSGSYITAGLATGLGALIWTDIDLWSMTYQGLPYVFGFNQVGTNCGALSKRSPAVIGQQVIWPSLRGFFRYAGGAITPVECPVWDWFYNNIDIQQAEQVTCALNVLYNEVAWYFRTTVPDTRYVKWNFLENLWDFGILDRTAWVDHTPYSAPVGSDSLGGLFVHENSHDADGSPIVCYGQTGYYDLQDGNEMQNVKAVIPDFLLSANATLMMTILATDNPGDPPRSYGPYAITATTRRFNVSLRGRQIAFRFASSDLGSTWRTGATRVSVAPAGSRP
jgi:hypothetical protein